MGVADNNACVMDRDCVVVAGSTECDCHVHLPEAAVHGAWRPTAESLVGDYRARCEDLGRGGSCDAWPAEVSYEAWCDEGRCALRRVPHDECLAFRGNEDADVSPPFADVGIQDASTPDAR